MLKIDYPAFCREKNLIAVNKKIVLLANAIEDFNIIPSEGFVRPKQFAKVLGINISTFYKYISEGKIPKDFKVTEGMALWSVNTVHEVLKKRLDSPFTRTSADCIQIFILPSEGFIRPAEFAFCLGISKSSLNRFIKNHFIKPPMQDSPKLIYWHVDTVRETIVDFLRIGVVGGTGTFSHCCTAPFVL